MGYVRTTVGLGILAALGVAGAGCSRQDTERLARVARVTVQKVEAMTADVGERLSTGWHSFRGNLDEVGLDARVMTRLRWDKALLNTPIRVEARGAVVELHGTVATMDQRRRAVALAEATVGVQQVIDALEFPPKEQ
jgi:hyperosmotically inducible protein